MAALGKKAKLDKAKYHLGLALSDLQDAHLQCVVSTEASYFVHQVKVALERAVQAIDHEQDNDRKADAVASLRKPQQASVWRKTARRGV